MKITKYHNYVNCLKNHASIFTLKKKFKQIILFFPVYFFQNGHKPFVCVPIFVHVDPSKHSFEHKSLIAAALIA
ncbi:hypothetical protein BpHYR1_013583 [Brachionus plicatilis]|uniref:Uncharacterized protein n=1 Tax=Brachionus plicatilis TaxID=10195 RepID=A0A3M7QNZ6_BRAPC|nr:hypothetical protein BpHYR1_013583 [Brachionus plicatilis]